MELSGGFRAAADIGRNAGAGLLDVGVLHFFRMDYGHYMVGRDFDSRGYCGGAVGGAILYGRSVYAVPLVQGSGTGDHGVEHICYGVDQFRGPIYL